MPSFSVGPNQTNTSRQSMSGADSGFVDVLGILSVSDKNQTIRFNGVTSDAVITNDGLIENTAAEGRAIRFEAAVGTTPVATINNSATGTIQSNDDTIQVEAGTVDSGTITVNNAGKILSVSGQGLDFGNVSGTFKAIVDNKAGAAIESGSEAGVRFGAVGELVNRGTINGGADTLTNSQGVDGVDFQDGASGTVENYGKGSISADRHGINAGENSTITVINGAVGDTEAAITGRNGSGIGSDGTATVTNYGTITGGYTPGVDENGSTVGQEDGGGPDGTFDGDGDGIDVDGELTLENFGTVQGIGANGNGSDGLKNTSEGIAAGGGTINNHAGASIIGAGLGILIDDSSQGDAPFLTTIDNDGTISAGAGIAIRIISAHDDVIRNSGKIEGVGTAIEFGTGDNTLFVEDGSDITGVSKGGLGSDTLDYRSYTSGGAIVDLSTGLASGTGGVTEFENVIGSAGIDVVTGSADANLIDGGKGADQMAGLGGDDTYVVDDAGDLVIEASGGGSDRVSARVDYKLSAGAEVELLTTTSSAGKGSIDLTGNTLSQTIVGNQGNNVLHDGGHGSADILRGGGGNDVYVVYNAADVVVEGSAQGAFDRVLAGVDYRLGADVHVEALRATSLQANYDLDLTGNRFAQEIIGNNGANILNDGGKGAADTLTGLKGDDTYYVYNSGDTIIEAAGDGVDRVVVGTSFALTGGAEIEQMNTSSAGNISAFDLTGNEFGQSITGNAGANRIDGGAGADTLRGLGGADIFAFTTAPGGGNSDTIVDFASGVDHIELDATVFATLAVGVLGAGMFSANASGLAQDADDRIVYDTDSGALFYDADGVGGSAGIQFATLLGAPGIDASDFVVV
ncbi:beta strand repeat-containing protein [Mesorhizobium sp. ASY16-5R]|uniref:beta strand repeat-containing protein n=1 Tax=Mesorhizobium sp. ASY16-5R TaxID=3445772 RepID=UPI003FA0666B